MDTASPPSKRRRQKENVPNSTYAKCSANKMGSRKQVAKKVEPTPQAARLCTALSTASLASAISVGTAFVQPTALTECSNTQQKHLLDETTSPRLDSRLARRPREQFPCSLQPFHIMPPPPGDQQGVSVAEANRRIQQAQVLKERQQHFDQLIDLASTGFLLDRQCGIGQPVVQPQLGPQAIVQAVPVGVMPAPPPDPGQAEPQLPQPAAMAAEPIAPVVQGPRSLTSMTGVTMLPSRTGRGCIRILRMD